MKTAILGTAKSLIVRIGDHYYKVAYGVSGNLLQAWINAKIKEVSE
jgi:hypothetical protein